TPIPGTIRRRWPRRCFRYWHVGNYIWLPRYMATALPTATAIADEPLELTTAPGGTMAMTAAVKDELSRDEVTKPCCRRAEMTALLRFAGGLHLVGGTVVVEAELDTGAVARRLRREIAELYGYPSEIHVLASGGLRRASHYIVRVVRDGEDRKST